MTTSLGPQAAHAATQTDLACLADQYRSDKGFTVLNSHGYTRVYEHLLAPLRERPCRILEVGLLHPDSQAELRTNSAPFAQCPSLDMWADYCPQASVVGLDICDFSGYRRDRVQILRADQGDRDSLRAALAQVGGGFDLIIDDGSHASHHQQITLGCLFPFVVPGGAYVVEDLHWQPPALEQPGIVTTRRLLQVLGLLGDLAGVPSALLESEAVMLARDARDVAFFDSLDRWQDPYRTRDTLAVIRKHG